MLHQLDIDAGLGSIWHGEFMLLHCEVLMREHNDVECLSSLLSVDIGLERTCCGQFMVCIVESLYYTLKG